MTLRLTACVLGLLIGLPSCSDESETARANPASPTVAAGTSEDLPALAERARELMMALDRSPDDQGLQWQLHDLFLAIFSSEWPVTGNVSDHVYGQMLVRADDYAQAGSALFLESIMRASRGPYGQTAEGSEWFAEILWANLERNPTMTILVGIENQGEWPRLLDSVYTQPPHDNYDFGRIAEGLNVPWDEEVIGDVRRILEAVESFL
jgi:hypothetical protein